MRIKVVETYFDTTAELTVNYATLGRVAKHGIYDSFCQTFPEFSPEYNLETNADTKHNSFSVMVASRGVTDKLVNSCAMIIPSSSCGRQWYGEVSEVSWLIGSWMQKSNVTSVSLPIGNIGQYGVTWDDIAANLWLLLEWIPGSRMERYRHTVRRKDMH